MYDQKNVGNHLDNNKIASLHNYFVNWPKLLKHKLKLNPFKTNKFLEGLA